jgi:hypothetical protein
LLELRKVLQEEALRRIFGMILIFRHHGERSKKNSTLILAYLIKVLQEPSHASIGQCVRADKGRAGTLHVKDGASFAKRSCLYFQRYQE